MLHSLKQDSYSLPINVIETSQESIHMKNYRVPCKTLYCLKVSPPRYIPQSPLLAIKIGNIICSWNTVMSALLTLRSLKMKSWYGKPCRRKIINFLEAKEFIMWMYSCHTYCCFSRSSNPSITLLTSGPLSICSYRKQRWE